ncbi:unnamed protein product [Prorocentrum cordatum]|uniref:Uncharacterized protein n=1 Tax=Prorocentrum cordatum TaxID=2364126 RepID=A0ABN9WI16_9DINO|nr:unnamed protein product [Polarella glacialis]
MAATSAKAAAEAQVHKKLKKTPSEETAVKACRDNFKSYTDEEIFVQRGEDETTIFENVLAQVRKKKRDRTVKMGGLFYRRMKEKHPKKNDHSEVLVGASPPEPVAPLLFKALVASNKTRPDHTLMVTYIGANEAKNKNEIVGIVKWAIKLNPKAPKNVKFLQPFLKFVVRTKVAEKYGLIYDSVVRPFANKVVSAMWDRATGTNVKNPPTAQKFCESHPVLIRSVFPQTPLTAVLGCNGNYAKVKNHLDALVSCGEAGLDIWSFALIGEASREVSKLIEQLSDEWIAAGDLTQDGLDAVKFSIYERITQVKNFDLVPDARTVVVKCAGHSFTIDFGSFASEISVSLNFRWRPMAVAQKKLPKLWCEDVVLKNPQVASARAIGECLCAQPKVAREACNRAFQEAGSMTGEQTATYLRANRGEYDDNDGDFEGDAQLIFSTCGVNSEARLIAHMASLFPTAEVAVEPDELLQKITGLTKVDVYKMASKPAQVKHGVVQKVLLAIVDDRCPDVSALWADKSLIAVKDQFPYLVRAEKSASADDSAATTVFGFEALQLKLKTAQTTLADEQTIAKGDVRELITYRFLVPTGELAPFDAVIGRAEGTATPKAKGAKAKPSAKGSGEKTSKAVSAAMAMCS